MHSLEKKDKTWHTNHFEWIRYNRVIEYHNKDVPKRKNARLLGPSKKTVKKYIQRSLSNEVSHNENVLALLEHNSTDRAATPKI